MDAIETEFNTQGVQNYASSFFTKLPTDQRYHLVKLEQIVPSTGLSKTSTTIEFTLPKRPAPQVYLVGGILLEVQVVIVNKKDGVSVPEKTRNVAPINDCLNSLFESVVTQVNHTKISGAPENFPFKCYLQNILTFNSDIKTSILESQGFSPDTNGNFNSVQPTENSGFVIRNNAFRDDDDTSPKAYKPEGARFIGKFNHDLANIDKPMPPNTRVFFELKRSSSEFYLMKSSDDPNEYQAIITDCNLFVPVGWLSEPMLREISSRLSKEAITYHFRRYTVLKLGIARNKQEFSSDLIFTESENPVRVFFVVAETQESFTKNAMDFQRKWTFEVSSENYQSLANQIEQNDLRMRLDLMMQMLQNLQPKVGPPQEEEDVSQPGEEPEASGSSGPNKGKGKGKSSDGSTFRSIANYITRSMSRRASQGDNDDDPDFVVLRNEAVSDLVSLVHKESEGQTAASKKTRPAAEPIPETKVTKTIFITKCQLQINSDNIGTNFQL